MVDDVSVRFGGDTSALNASVAKARQAIATFSANTSQAKTALDAFTAAMRSNKDSADSANASWRENLSIMADITIVARGAADAVGSIFSSAVAITRADFQADADAIRGIAAAASATSNAMDAADDSFTGFFTGAAQASRGSRLFEQANVSLRTSIGRVILAVENYFTAAGLLSQGTVAAQLAAITAAGNFDRFSDAVAASGDAFGRPTEALAHFTSELAKIPDMTKEIAADIQATIASVPNFDISTNDLLIKYLQEVSADATEAQQRIKALATSFTSATGGSDLATNLVGGIDFTDLDKAKGKIEDLVTLAKQLGQNFRDPAQAKAFYDTLISKSDQYGRAAMQPLVEQLQSFEKLGVFGRVLELGIQSQVEKQASLNTELSTALRLLQEQAAAAAAITASKEREEAFQKLLNDDGTRVSRIENARDNITTLQSHGQNRRKDASDPDDDGHVEIKDEELDRIARTIIAEAANQGKQGMEAVAAVIQNRLDTGYGGAKSATDVVNAPKQFSAWNPGDPAGAMANATSTDSAVYRQAMALAKQMQSGDLDDPTNGATSYKTNNLPARPGEVESNQSVIGSQRFFNTPQSPKVNDDDDQAKVTERVQEQYDAIRKLNAEKQGGTNADLADVDALQQQAAGMHDVVAQAQAKLAASQKDLEATKGGSPEAIEAATRKVAEAQVELTTKTEAARKAQAELNIALARPNSPERHAAQMAEYDQEITAARGNAAEISNLEKSKADANREYENQRKQDTDAANTAALQNTLNALKAEEEAIQEKGKVGILSHAEETADLQANLAKQLAAQRAALEQRKALFGQDTTEFRKANEQELELDQKNNLQRQKNALAANTAIYSSYREEFERIGSTVSSSLVGIIEGTSNFRTLMQNVAKQILAQFVDMGVKMVADWLARQAASVAIAVTSETAKTSAVTAGEAARTSAVASGASAQAAVTGSSIIASITASAAETFAGIFGFLSPVLGPAAAGPAAGGQATVLAAAAAIPSFAVGAWSLPSDMVAQVHAGEMIVPAGPAAAMRNAMSGGGAGSAGGGDVHSHAHFNVTAMDSRDVKRFFSENSKHIMGAINDGIRSGSHLGLRKLGSPIGA